MKIQRAIHLLTALKASHRRCGLCQTEGDVYNGHNYVPCSSCKGKGYKPVNKF